MLSGARTRARRDGATVPRPRRRIIQLIAAAAAAVLVASGVVLATTTTAEAHTPKVAPSCSGVQVSLLSYNGSKGEANSVTFTQDGVATTTKFGSKFEKFIPFTDPSTATTWSVDVDAWDDPGTKGWDYTTSQTSQPCPAPAIDLSATQCTEPGATSDLTAGFTGLVASKAYDVAISKNGSTVDALAKSFTADRTEHSVSWTGLEPGASYEVRVTERGTTLSAAKSVTIEPCPENAAIEITIDQCTAPGYSATVNVLLSDLVAGRQYTATLVGANGTRTFVAQGPSETLTFSAPAPGTEYRVTLTDSVTKKVTTSNTVTAVPCPTQPATPVLQLADCTLGQAAGELKISLDQLQPGREYEVTINGAAIDGGRFTADAAQKDLVVDVEPGKRLSVTVADVLASKYASSDTVTSLACALVPSFSLAASVCTAPGDSADLTVELDGRLAAGRSYDVAISQDLEPVPNQRVQTVVASAGMEPVVYRGLTPGLDYTVTVADTRDDGARASVTEQVAACPRNPALAMDLEQCTAVGGKTAISVGLKDLEDGEDYTAKLERVVDGDYVAAGKVAGIVSGDERVTFDKLVAGSDYRVTVANSTGVLHASETATARACPSELPTLPIPPGDLPTLAMTGASATGPVVGALALLQIGLALVVIGFVRRRRAS
ncbi:hypothetical protein [Homoserinibacter sp. YIM 151385]|uniref:hypothetical protein n=1 Tax=Homoserinibacter sp. YIM 151385 TaxID=2985506 RepID=UPI0022F05056|nr:hypothetical protein [Homoserinibacter sp. YIM 151385]WBU36929.1 hypothetical protein OF852_08285 [Homoserinibacter sp. YIM 151385]